jgi:hypothetical protein
VSHPDGRRQPRPATIPPTTGSPMPSLPTVENIAQFSVSRLEHFDLFKGLPFRSFNAGEPDPAICDLKVYQDYLAYCFVRANVAKGSRVLEVGGGDSRVLRFLSKDYECWNVDKCEGLGAGPRGFTSRHFRIVYDYLGNSNPELPTRYFDFVFSISALEHTPEDPAVREAVRRDLERVSKPGSPSFHLLDCVWRPGGQSSVNGLIPHLYETLPLRTRFVDPALLGEDPGVYFMSRAAFDASWKAIVGTSYEEFGRPYSMNLFWLAGG